MAGISPVMVGVGLAAAAVVMGGSSSRRKKGAVKKGIHLLEAPIPGSEGQEELQYLAEWAFLDAEWMAFLEATAYRESGFNNLRGLGLPNQFPDWARPSEGASFQTQQNEADAARQGYENNSYLASCPWPASRYTFGSGGWFGMIPAFGVRVFKGTKYACIDPWAVFDPPASLVMAMGFGRGLTNWKNFKKKPTWLNLRVGWGNPSAMGKPDRMAKVQQKFGDQLEEVGYPRALMHNPVTALPPDLQQPAELLDALLEVW